VAVLTSEGKDRAGADGAKARWIDMNGTVDGKLAGVALLEHPSNHTAPNSVRMHPEMPYYVFAIPQAGRFTLEAGKEYKSSDLRRAEERLVATRIFKKVRVSPSSTQQEAATVPIEIDVEERESGEASVRAGYGSFEGLRLGADLTAVNIWGGAESLRVGGNFSKVGYRGETELGVPYLGGTDLRLGLSGYYESREYPSFDALSRGAVLGFSYPVLEMLTATLGLRYANIITTNVDPSVPPGDLLDFNYTALFFSPTLDLRDNALNPTRGMLLAGEVSWSPSYLLSDVEFWSAGGRFSYFFPFPAGIVFATSFQGGVIAPIGGTDTIPIALREFAGGTNTVRGYKFESIGPKVNGEPTGGEVFLALQTEVRFPLVGDLQGVLFFDEGGVWFDRLRVNLAELRYAVGTGLRFVTPAGALSADLGWNPHPRQAEYPLEFHPSVGFPF
jgi:translocation and assembly module TamA